MSDLDAPLDVDTWGNTRIFDDPPPEDTSYLPPVGIERRSVLLIRDGELLNRPRPRDLIAGVLPEHGFAVIVGQSGAGKSFVRIGLAGSIATGLRWHGQEVMVSGPVISVIGEGHGHEASRVLAWKRAHHQPLDENCGTAYAPMALNVLDRDEVRRFAEATADEHPVLFWFDTWSTMMAVGGGDENSARDVSIAVTNLRYELQEPLGCTIAVVHHSGWGEAVRERGSSALRGAADAVLTVKPVGDLTTVKAEKQRDSAPDLDLSLRLVPVPESDSCVLRLAAEVIRSDELSAQERKALAILRANFPSMGATCKEWESSSGIPLTSVYRVAKVLEDRGLIRKSGQRYAVTGLEPTQ